MLITKSKIRYGNILQDTYQEADAKVTIPDPSIVSKGDRIYVFVNKRPINYARSELKEMVSIVRKRYQQAAGSSDGIFMDLDQD